MNTVMQGICTAIDFCSAGTILTGVKSSQPRKRWLAIHHLTAKCAIFSHNSEKQRPFTGSYFTEKSPFPSLKLAWR